MENGEQAIKEEKQLPPIEKQPQYEKPWYKRLWERTIFPDLIEKKKQKRINKAEEEKYKEELYKEIREECKDAIKNKLKEKVVNQEVEKLIGGDKKKSNILQKVADDFKQDLGSMGNKNIGDMMGMGQQPSTTKQTKKKGKEVSWEDKIKNMLK